ncbi:cilia- and flagella-associated protein 54-like [Delphinus delphis]|uniref:cilia- and flagella-associated protein 54-like n=1 Tax=Delphinus delphis TaxID=9728 RepID=UPI0028C493DA|nr:cilia- and flagella-associated protein 54-like [Delphinus delphis]
MSKLLASLKPGSGMSLPGDTLLTSLFNSGLILRQKEMHFFLKRFLQLYSSSCIDEFPKELFQVIENPSFPEKFLYDSSSKLGTTDSSLHSNLSLKLFASPSYGDVMSSVVATQALNKELCFQWYIPPLEKPPKETEPMVLLLYAYNMKPLNISDVTSTAYNNVYVGSFWVPLNRVISVHEKLSNLTQIAEISLPTTPKVTSNENVSQVEETEEESIEHNYVTKLEQCGSSGLYFLYLEYQI